MTACGSMSYPILFHVSQTNTEMERSGIEVSVRAKAEGAK